MCPTLSGNQCPSALTRLCSRSAGKEDNYGGWLRALHTEARLPDASVTVKPGETTVVELIESSLHLRGSRIGATPCEKYL